MEIKKAGSSVSCPGHCLVDCLETDLVMRELTGFHFGQPFQPIRFVIQQEDQPGMERG
jgi:hypothetical protein